MYAKSNEKGIESIVEDIQRSMYPEKYTIYKEKKLMDTSKRIQQIYQNILVKSSQWNKSLIK